MTKWFNIGVALTDSSQKEQVKTTLEDLGLKVYSDREKTLKVTETDRRFKDNDIVLDALQNHIDAIRAVIIVEANDSADTAHASVYEVVDGAFERNRVKSQHSGGQDSRYDWHGVVVGDLRVNGGKYY